MDYAVDGVGLAGFKCSQCLLVGLICCFFFVPKYIIFLFLPWVCCVEPKIIVNVTKVRKLKYFSYIYCTVLCVDLFIPNSIHSWHSNQTSQTLHLKDIHFPSLSTSHTACLCSVQTVCTIISAAYRHFLAFIPNTLLLSTLFRAPHPSYPLLILYVIYFSHENMYFNRECKIYKNSC